jgi:hypothetical protein
LRRSQTGATADEIGHELKDEPCRYPGQGCHYEQNGVCTIKAESVDLVLKSLKDRQVLTLVTHEPPFEWRVQL